MQYRFKVHWILYNFIDFRIANKSDLYSSYYSLVWCNTLLESTSFILSMIRLSAVLWWDSGPTKNTDCYFLDKWIDTYIRRKEQNTHMLSSLGRAHIPTIIEWFIGDLITIKNYLLAQQKMKHISVNSYVSFNVLIIIA